MAHTDERLLAEIERYVPFSKWIWADDLFISKEDAIVRFKKAFIVISKTDVNEYSPIGEVEGAWIEVRQYSKNTHIVLNHFEADGGYDIEDMGFSMTNRLKAIVPNVDFEREFGGLVLKIAAKMDRCDWGWDWKRMPSDWKIVQPPPSEVVLPEPKKVSSPTAVRDIEEHLEKIKHKHLSSFFDSPDF